MQPERTQPLDKSGIETIDAQLVNRVIHSDCSTGALSAFRSATPSIGTCPEPLHPALRTPLRFKRNGRYLGPRELDARARKLAGAERRQACRRRRSGPPEMRPVKGQQGCRRRP
jgi:hypothetical protein